MALNEKQQQAYNRIISGKSKTLLVGEAGCVDAKTQYLTPKGWKYISEFTQGDIIAVITSALEIKWEQPLAYISEPSATKAYHIIDNSHRSNINMCITYNHRVPYKTSKNNLKIVPAIELINSLNKPKNANGYTYAKGYIPLGITNSFTSIDLTDNQLRLLIAIQADSNITQCKSHRYIIFNLKKERKIQRLIKLLNLNKIKYKHKKLANNYSRIRFRLDKYLIATKDLSHLYLVSKHQAIVVTKEIQYWDGSVDNRTNNQRYHNSNKTNIDVIQYCMTLANNTLTSISVDNRIGKKIHKDKDYTTKSIVYTAYRTNKKTCRIQDKYVHETIINHQYCFTTSTSMWLARRNNFIFITGNSGKSYTVSQIIKAFDPEDIALTATTHKAKTVISQMSGMQAHTVHSYFGFKIAQNGYTQTLVNVNKNIKPIKLVIIDEISLLPQQILNLLLHLNKKKIIKQLLLIGDPIQLKAVSDPPDLTPFLNHTIELTEQMRQQPEVSLTEYFKRLRTAIETTKMPSLKAVIPNITFISSHKEFCDIYNNCNTNKKILAYRNIVVDKYNYYIHGNSIFRQGDDVIIDKPLGKARNGDEVKVKSSIEDDEKFTIEVITSLGSIHQIYHYKSVSTVNKQLDLYRKQDNKHAYWYLFNNSFRLKHSYACTIHKAQGETYDTVFVDAADIIAAYQVRKSRYNNPISLDTFLRLYYVALSRMKSQAYVYTGADNKGRSYKTLKAKGKQLE